MDSNEYNSKVVIKKAVNSNKYNGKVKINRNIDLYKSNGKVIISSPLIQMNLKAKL